MDTSKPLKLATCIKCGAKFFIAEPRDGLPWARRVLVRDTSPAAQPDREVVRHDCPRCKHPQFVEFWYGG